MVSVCNAIRNPQAQLNSLFLSLFFVGLEHGRKKNHRILSKERWNRLNLPLIPPAEAPPNFPTPQSPYSSLTSSRIIFARRPGVSASEVGEWMASCAEVDVLVDLGVVEGHVAGSG